MTLHLVKLAVGVDTVSAFETHLARRLAAARQRGERPEYRHITRRMPSRAAELLDGGSLYWVVSGLIRVRQRLLRLETLQVDGKPACALVLESQLIPTYPQPHRPFQGWRYLPPEKAPRDADAGSMPPQELPTALARELRDLGLL